ncbi:sensor histidine kinase [Roseateles sp. DB2]|uniref:sensor histidine kinase n=1 Tax=Roseateles sp. DB2 TaxID=3453717 RepID=UPI003EEC3C47
MTSTPGQQWRAAFTDSWRLRKTHEHPWWMGQLACVITGMAVGAAFVLLAALLSANLLNFQWWTRGLAMSMQLGAVIALLSCWSLRLLERLLPAERLARLNEGQDLQSLLVFIGIPTLCSGLGLWLVEVLQRWRLQGVLQLLKLPHKGALITFLFCGAGFACLSLWRARTQLRAQKARSQLSEAQLRLLQAQIEPHFLFNTLANVQGLIDYDPVQAKHMLDAFTDYLRASLLQMRAQDVSLAQELALVQSYLAVMHCRMGDRLQTRLDVPDTLLTARLPPLLLQPLIENAIHHGLEPRLEGGLLQLSARPLDSGLQIDIQDSGVGLARSRERPRRGHGMALQNIRERLLAVYGPDASLELTELPGSGGTLARLKLPRQHPFPSQDHD